MQRISLVLLACVTMGCHFEEANPGEHLTDVDETALSCVEEAAMLECGPGSTLIMTVEPGEYQYTTIDQLNVDGSYDGITNGVVLGGGTSSIVTSVIEKDGCFAACVLDNPCDGHTPSIADLEEGAAAPPTPPPPSCVVSPVNPYGLGYCYYCGEEGDEIDLQECSDFALACNGLDPDNPPPIPGDETEGLDETGADDGQGTDETGGVDETGGADDAGDTGADEGASPAHDCTDWFELSSSAAVNSQGVVYLPEPLVYYAAQQSGLDMALCDDVRFGFDGGLLELSSLGPTALLRKMGLRQGDRVVALNGNPIVDVDTAISVISEAFYSGPLEAFQLRIQRKNRQFVVPVYLR